MAMTLGKRITAGFLAILTLALILGLAALWTMGQVRRQSEMLAQEYAPEVALANDVERASLLTMFEMRGYGLTGEAKQFELARGHLAQVDKSLQECQTLAQHAPHLVQLKEALGVTQPLVKDYDQMSLQTQALTAEVLAGRAELSTAANHFRTAAEELQKAQENKLDALISSGAPAASLRAGRKIISSVNAIYTLGNNCRVLVWKAQALRDPKVLQEITPLFAKIQSIGQELRPLLAEQEARELEQMLQAAKQYQQANAKLTGCLQRNTELAAKRTILAQQVLTQARSISQRGIAHTLEIATAAATALAQASTILWIGLATVIAMGLLLAGLITASITSAVGKIVGNLTTGAQQVASASSQVSRASQTIAQGASEQAASIEETSSALEEIHAMTRQNLSIAQQGNQAMDRMLGAIKQMDDSSHQTASILKTIDEIAFQTNLLALNAAVEAARAGESGKGFAVVADEVRNLAMRSAEAAKKTAQHIDESLKATQQGVSLAKDVAVILGQINTSSAEQARGVDQVRSSTTQLDSVTQQSAASAEEFAATSEELDAQAKDLTSVVDSLRALVGR